jgi:hypothetical protein
MQESDLLEYKRPENEEGKAVFEYTEREGEVGKTGGREKRGKPAISNKATRRQGKSENMKNGWVNL